MALTWKDASNEVIVDALPYIDHVDEETKRYKSTKNYLEHLPPLKLTDFETPIMKHEFQRIANHTPLEMMNMRRYELPQPPSTKMNDLTAWTEAVENSMAQLEHQATRISNLELMSEYGTITWKNYIEVLNGMVDQLRKEVLAIKKKTQEVNWQRKNQQTQMGKELEDLESNWVGLVSKNYEIERAIVELDKEIQRIRTHKEKLIAAS